MLIITRKCNQAIMIGDVKLVVTKIERGVVRLGFEADPSITINREEVQEEINKKNREEKQK